MKETASDPIAIALREDIGAGDITTEFFVPEGLHALGRIIVRERAIVAKRANGRGSFSARKSAIECRNPPARWNCPQRR